MDIRVLPEDARQLLARLNAAPRLVAHLTLVHDAAFEILDSLQAQWPDLEIDKAAVLFGAGTHDVGKVLHPDELFGPGSQHEKDGPAFLEALGFSPDRSRFARTHGTWKHEPNLTLEDYLVALADHCWKGTRDEQLESKLSSHIADSLGIPAWEAFLGLDEIVSEIASQAEKRLAWQRRASK